MEKRLIQMPGGDLIPIAALEQLGDPGEAPWHQHQKVRVLTAPPVPVEGAKESVPSKETEGLKTHVFRSRVWATPGKDGEPVLTPYWQYIHTLEGEVLNTEKEAE